MDREIQQLVKEVTPLGDPFRVKNPLPYRWQKAMRLWNRSHVPEKTTLREVECAFKNRWPCSTAEYCDNGRILKMTIPNLAFSVSVSPVGILRGYFKSGTGRQLESDIYMNPAQLAEFLSSVLNIVYSRMEIDEIESKLTSLSAEIDDCISNVNQVSEDDFLTAEQAITIFGLHYEKYGWLSRLNRHEEALDAIKDVLLYYDLIEQFEERNDIALYGGIMIGDAPFPYDTLEYILYAELCYTLLMLGRLNEAIMSCRSLYDRKLKYVEQNRIWPGYNFDGLDETKRYGETVAFVHEYCRWVDNYCNLLSIARHDNKAVEQISRSINAVKSFTLLKDDDSLFFLEWLKGCLKRMQEIEE